jgi:hypothetical protein
LLDFNLIVPQEDRDKIMSLSAEDFIVVHKAKNKNEHFFLIRATEEDMIMLTLKYGKDKVWKR